MPLTFTPMEEAQPVAETSGLKFTPIEEEKPEVSLFEALKPAPALAVSGLVKSAAGLANIVGADETAASWRRGAEAAEKQVQTEAPVDETTWKGAARGAATSILTQAPAIALGALTGGATLPLTTMALQAGTQKMSDLTAADVSYAKALPLSIASGSIEAITEKIPFTSFLKIIKGNKGIGSAVIKMLIGEQLGEQAATLGDTVIDQVKPETNWSWEDYKKAVVATAKATLLQSGTMAAGGVGVGKVVNKLKRENTTTTTTPTSTTTISTNAKLPPTEVAETPTSLRQRRVEKEAAKKAATEIAKKQALATSAEEAMIKAKEPEGNIIIETDPVSDVVIPPDEVKFVTNKVKELGSVEAVAKLYSDQNAKIDIFANDLAKKMFGEVSTPKETVSVQELAERRHYVELESNKIRMAGGTPDIVKLWEEAPAKIAEQKTAKAAEVGTIEEKQPPSIQNLKVEDQTPLTYEELVALNKKGYPVLADTPTPSATDLAKLTPDQLEVQQKPIQKNIAEHTPEEWRAILAKKEDEIVPSEQELELARKAAAKIESSGNLRKQKMMDLATLKEDGFSDKQISKMSESQIAQAAAGIRGEIAEVPISTANLPKLTAFEAELRQLVDEIAGKPIEEWTPEQIVRVEKMQDKSLETEVPEIFSWLEKPHPFDLVNPDGTAKYTWSQYKELATGIRRRWEELHKPKVEKPTEKQTKQANRLRKQVEKAVEGEVGIGEKEIEKTEGRKKEKPETAEDWEAKLAEEGMAAEPEPLNFEESEDPNVIKNLLSNIEEWIAASEEKIENNREYVEQRLRDKKVFTSNEDARNTIVAAYGVRPKDLADFDAWYAQVVEVERRAAPMLDQKRSAFSYRELARARREGKISDDEYRFAAQVFRSLKQQPTFKLVFDEKLIQRKGSIGLYDFAGDILTFNKPSAIAHEVMHFGFYNVLTSSERLAYLKDYRDQFYKTGKLDKLALFDRTSEPHNAIKNPSEMFASRGADYLSKSAFTPVEDSLFAKVRGWWNKIADGWTKDKAKFQEVSKYFDKIVDSNARRTWVEGSRQPVAMERVKHSSLVDAQEAIKRLARIHPAPFPKGIQETMASIAKELGITNVLDIFGGIGKIGGMKKFGYEGRITANDIEAKWGGDTISTMRDNGVDTPMVGDSRNLSIPSDSIQAIFTSPTYGNAMGLRSRSKKDSYQGMLGEKLSEGNTGGEVWGPVYEQLHKEVYKEANRVVQPGGYFVLNMKDKPVSAADQKNNWIPKKGSSVVVKDGTMRATDWHIKALEEAGFNLVKKIKIDEAPAISSAHRLARRHTVGYEDIVIMQKPENITEEQSVWHGTKAMFDKFRDAFIGSGEGAQVRGWGHYFTSSKKVGEWYAKSVGSSKTILKDLTGVQLDKAFIDVANSYYEQGLITDAERNSYINKTDRRSSKLALVDGFVNSTHVPGSLKKAVLGDLVEITKGKVLHEVELPDDLNLLDLDKNIPTSAMQTIAEGLRDIDFKKYTKDITLEHFRQYNLESFEKAKAKMIGKTPDEDIVSPMEFEKVLAKAGEPITDKIATDVLGEGIERALLNGKYESFDFEGFGYLYRYNGEDLQYILKEIIGSSKAASEFLRDKAGIHGNTYIGNSSGERNYVIFDENIPQVKSSVTLDMMGLQSLYERTAELINTFSKAMANTPGKRVLGEIQEPDWGLPWDTTRAVYAPTKDKNAIVRGFNKIRNPFRSPYYHELVAGGILEKHVYNANVAEMYWTHMANQHYVDIRLAEFGGTTSRLTEQEKKNVTTVLRQRMNKETETIQLSPVEAESARLVREWLDVMRNRYKASQLSQYKQNLNKSEYGALLDIISGTDPGQVALKYKRLNVETVLEIAKRHKEIDSWGLDDYIPNVESGRFKILAETTGKDGKSYRKLVGIGLSEKDATRKALAYLEQHPTSTNLFIDTDYVHLLDETTKVTQKQYGAMIGSLTKKIQESISNIENGVQVEIDKKTAKSLAMATIKKKFKITPTNAFSEFTLEKKDILQGEENIFPVLYSYAKSMEKKMALDPVIEQIKHDMGKMSGREREFITNYIDDVKGRYGAIDKTFDDIFGTYKGYSRLVGRTRSVEAMLKLGYRPVAAAVNFASGQGHTMVKVGLPIYTEAISYLKTPAGKQLMTSIEPYLGTSLMEVGTELKSKTSFAHPLGLFQGPEPINREICVAANYLKAIKEGKSPEAAREYAIRANMVQQFTYNVASLPAAMRGPTGKLLMQFKPYLVKELEFMSSLTGKEWLGYLGMQLALGGPRGYMMVLKSLPFLAMFGFYEDAMDSLEDWMNKNYPVASRGVGALPGLIKPEYGVDISAAATFQFPTSAKDFLGPFVSDMLKMNKDVIQPMLAYGPYMEDVKKGLGVAAVAKHWERLWQMVEHDDGWIRDQNGNRQYQVQSYPALIAQSLAGVENIDINRLRSAEAIEARRDFRNMGVKSRITNQVIGYIKNVQPLPEELLDRMMKHGVSVDTIINRIKNSEYPPDVRRTLMAETRRRFEVWENSPRSEDFETEVDSETPQSVPLL